MRTQFVIARQIHHFTFDELHGRRMTAIGIPEPTGDVLFEVVCAGDSQTSVTEQWQAIRRPKEQAPLPKREPVYRLCDVILEPPAWPKPDSEKIALCKDEPPLSEVFNAGLITQSSSYFIDALLGDAKKIEVVIESVGRQVTDLPSVRDNLSTFPAIYPNDVNPKRESDRTTLVLRTSQGGTLDSQWRRLSFLSHKAPLRAVVFDPAALVLEGWFDTASLSKAKLVSFAKLACELGIDPRSLLPAFAARMPNAICAKPAQGAFPMLHAALPAVFADRDKHRMRNFVLTFSTKD